MTNPRLRFKREDGTDYPDWEEITSDILFDNISEKGREDKIVLTVIQGVGTVPRNESGRNILFETSSLKNYKFAKKNDFIIHLRSFEGGLEIANSDGILSPAYRILRAKKEISHKFFYNYFHTIKFISFVLAKAVEGIRDGRQINYNVFKKLKFPFPCLEEQEKIADFLSDIDEVILASDQEVKKLQELKKGAMQKIFSQEVRFKRDDGTDYPDWEEKKLGDICNSFSGGTPRTGIDEYYNGNINFIRSGEIHDSKTELFISEEGLKNSSAKIVNVGDILLALYGATSGEIDLSKINGAINQAILCIRPQEGFNKKFIVEIFRYNKNNILKFYLQGGQGNLSAQNILKLNFPFPCLEEQQKIGDFLSDFDEAISLAKQELEKWKLLKKGLLQQMFT